MRRRARPRLAWALLACVLLGLAACSTTPRPWTAPRRGPDPYRLLDAEEARELRDAVRLYEAGDLTASRAAFASLAARVPGDVCAAIWSQEARVAWAERRAAGMRRVTEVRESPRAALRDRYRLEAEREPTALRYLLAARLEEDELAARLLLREALELDPGMSWAHYALAHVAARAGDWAQARDELERTFELQPDHLPALRLHGWLQAEAGDRAGAIAAMEAWLNRASDDWLATERTRDELRLDLALAYNAEGEEDRALELLEELAPGQVEEVRRLAALAVIEEERGDLGAARRAVLAARGSDPEALLPAVQEALLLELWVRDAEEARRAWREVIEIAGRSDDLAAGVQRLRAEVHLQRLERAASAREGRP